MSRKKKEINTVREQIYWAYVNLAMAHSAVSKGQNKYGMIHFMIRSKLYKGLNDGSMNIRTILDDEKIKLELGHRCNYCGAIEKLSIDHILPKTLGGPESADNFVYACQSCNSSKGKKDLIEWMVSRNQFLPLMLIRRYLKLVYSYCDSHDLMDKALVELETMELPFRIDLLPIDYPQPCELKLVV